MFFERGLVNCLYCQSGASTQLEECETGQAARWGMNRTGAAKNGKLVSKPDDRHFSVLLKNNLCENTGQGELCNERTESECA
jgi:hypothetical protein